jgi:TonB family protein
MQMETANTEAEVFTKPKPEFPNSELRRGREGWVLIAYTVTRSGLVGDLGIRDSSGNIAFEKAALDAVRQWRYKPGEERELSVLLNFVYDRQIVRLSRRFINLNDRANELIDKGDLDAAQGLLAEIRGDDDLTAFELAYSFLTEGHIAGERGNRAGQLQYFRKAMLNEGEWLARENYLACLRAAVILEIELGDFVTAVRDYELLTETRVGMKLGADLEDSIQALRAQIENDRFVTPPYVVADSSLSVQRERIGSSVTTGTQSKSDNRGRTPPPSPPPKKQK